MRNIKITVWVVESILLIFALLVLLFCYGCTLFRQAELPPVNPMPQALTSAQQMTKTLVQTNWLVTFAILGAGAAFFAFLNGNSKGLQAMAACLVVLSITLGIVKFSTTIAIVAMVCAIGLVIYTIGVRMMEHKALKEVVAGNELLKKEDGTITQSLINLFKEKQNEVQSKTTKTIVADIKKNGN